MSRPRDYSPATVEAARLLGGSIRIARKERRWTIEDLAERVGASHSTIRKVERGDLGVTLGIAFEAAALLRVPLFHEDPDVRRSELDRTQRTLRLLPKRTTPLPEPDDDF
jgi:transcriptional regulator with XRE-family HTH domain